MRPFLVLLCVLGAVIWAYKGKEGWGWFLFAALCLASNGGI